jgi:hypothetical protein
LETGTEIFAGCMELEGKFSGLRADFAIKPAFRRLWHGIGLAKAFRFAAGAV